MSRSRNPIFVTQRRLTRRAGVLAPLLVTALTGGAVLAGCLATLANQRASIFYTRPSAGRAFYGAVLGLEALILIVGGGIRITQTLTNERKSGMWDSNRLSPLSPARIVMGYWLGSALREFSMGAILAGIGLPIVLLAGLPITLWLGTQVLLLTTTLFVGLAGMMSSLVFQKGRSAWLLLLPFVLLLAGSWQWPGLSILQFVLPVHPVVNLFLDPAVETELFQPDWRAWPEVFGQGVSPIILSLALQLVVGLFFWRATVRMTAESSSSPWRRWEALALFAFVCATEHSLVWSLWRGRYHHCCRVVRSGWWPNESDILPSVHVGMLVLGAIILLAVSPLAERLRLESLRSKGTSLALAFRRSAVPTALLLTGIAAAISSLHFQESIGRRFDEWGFATLNTLVFLLMFSLLWEVCRLRFRGKAFGIVVLGLFMTCVLPMLVGALLGKRPIAEVSFLAPGWVALGSNLPPTDWQRRLMWITAAHLGLAGLLFLGWVRQWRKRLRPPTPTAESR